MSGAHHRFLDRLSNEVLLCDGGMGTMLYSKGIFINACFDELNLTAPGLVREIHAEYIRSGADIVETNTFGANRIKLKKHGLDDKVAVINESGARMAREAAGEGNFVAGSIGPLGVRIEPWGPTARADAEAAFEEQARALAGAGVDLFILETFSDLDELHLAIDAVRRAAKDLPVVAQMTIEEDGNSLDGMTPGVFARRLEDWGADVVGVNCSVGPASMLDCIEKMAATASVPLSAMPNAGVPREVEGRNIYLCSPDYMAEYARRFILAGVKLLGGCCGTTPAHIKAMRGAIRSLQPPRRTPVVPVLPEKKKLRVQPVLLGDKSETGRKLAKGEFVVSVEIVPPRGFNASKALATVRALGERGISCVNIPDGPRASARMSSIALAFLLAREAGIEPILHFACRDRNLLGMQSDLLGVYAHGIRNLLIVTGDPPKMGDYPDATAVFDVDSIGLATLVRSLNSGIDIGGKEMELPTGFLIGVGANPGAVNLDYELGRFKAKVAAGAEFAVTQPVFDVRLLRGFLSRIADFRIPVLAGIWPLTSLRNAEFMNNEVPGASVPDEIMDRMRKAQERGPEEAREEGVRIAAEVLESVKGLVQGVQISPPLGRIDLALRVLDAL
ncbi:MAG: bifunctional homocysteine S-methyltransferase/methylenetetrahydrofolate reductase [Candidatus Aminicenantales bacterium]